MKKKGLLVLLLIASQILCSCTLFKKTIDERSGFSRFLSETHDYMERDRWVAAEKSLEKAHEAWEKLRPLLQIDIDHDYIHEIDHSFTKLKVYVKLNDKSEGLATLLLIMETWKYIGYI